MAEVNGLVFRLNDHGQGPEILRQVFLERGWLEYDEDVQEEHEWNLWWRTSRFRTSDYDQILPWQRLNHYPKTTGITKKDSLARTLKRMRGIHGPSVYNFSPLAFNLPNDYTKFVAEYTKCREKEQGKQIFWICKPADLSRGRGIFLFRELSELQYDCNAVVQRYIVNPLLIAGYKFDLRIYVAVSSFHPLNVYIYQEGIVRFSTEKFDLNSLNNLYSHLTNTSINKHSPTYNADKERIGPGCKWTITQLRHYLHQNHIDDRVLWTRIEHIILLTIVTQCSQVPKVGNCFEVYGFDIIIDENLKPWLLEVNFSPALSSDCQTDLLVKKPMLHDLLDLMNFRSEDLEFGGESFTQRKVGRRYVPAGSGYKPKVKRLPKPRAVGKLPVIPKTTSEPSSLHNSRSVPVSELENESNPVPIVPGCGLPSVQQRLDTNLNSAAVRSSSMSQGQRTDSSHEPDPVFQSPDVLRKNSSVKGMRRQDSTSALSRVHVKKLSKVSLMSDSGYSGSSDGSDMTSFSEENMHDRNGASLSRQQLESSKRQRLVRKPAAEEDCTEDADTSEIHPVTLTSSMSSIDHQQVTQHADRNLLSSKKSASRSVQGTPSIKSAIHRTPQRGQTRRKPLPISGTLTAHSSMLNHRNSVGAYPVGTHYSSAYSQTWWKSRESTSYNAMTSQSIHGPSHQYGDFMLAFPFNEATRKTALNNLDVRVIIHECQKVLKEVQSESKATKAGASDAVTRTRDPANPSSVWGPVKLPMQTHINS